METLQQTSLNLRDAGIDNIKKFCIENKCENEFNEIKNHLMQEADKFNLLLPVDFYAKFYNLTIEYLK